MSASVFQNWPVWYPSNQHGTRGFLQEEIYFPGTPQVLCWGGYLWYFLGIPKVSRTTRFRTPSQNRVFGTIRIVHAGRNVSRPRPEGSWLAALILGFCQSRSSSLLHQSRLAALILGFCQSRSSSLLHQSTVAQHQRVVL